MVRVKDHLAILPVEYRKTQSDAAKSGGPKVSLTVERRLRGCTQGLTTLGRVIDGNDHLIRRHCPARLVALTPARCECENDFV